MTMKQTFDRNASEYDALMEKLRKLAYRMWILERKDFWHCEDVDEYKAIVAEIKRLECGMNVFYCPN